MPACAPATPRMSRSSADCSRRSKAPSEAAAVLLMVCELLSSAAETELALAGSPDPALNGAILLVCWGSAVPPLARVLLPQAFFDLQLDTQHLDALWHEQLCIFHCVEVGLCNIAIWWRANAPMLDFKIQLSVSTVQCSHSASLPQTEVGMQENQCLMPATASVRCAKGHPLAHARVHLLLVSQCRDGLTCERLQRGGVETGKGDGVKPSMRPSVLSAPKNRKLPQAIRFGMAAGVPRGVKTS